MKKRVRRNHSRCSRRSFIRYDRRRRTISQLAEQFGVHPDQITRSGSINFSKARRRRPHLARVEAWQRIDLPHHASHPRRIAQERSMTKRTLIVEGRSATRSEDRPKP
jgi:hypothetical protein